MNIYIYGIYSKIQIYSLVCTTQGRIIILETISEYLHTGIKLHKLTFYTTCFITPNLVVSPIVNSEPSFLGFRSDHRGPYIMPDRRRSNMLSRSTFCPILQLLCNSVVHYIKYCIFQLILNLWYGIRICSTVYLSL